MGRVQFVLWIKPSNSSTRMTNLTDRY